MKKIFTSFVIVTTSFLFLLTPTFAADSLNVTSSTSATVPIYLTAETTSIDFTVTETIDAEIESNRTLLDIDQITITNLGTVGQLSIDGMSVTPETGWTIVSDETDFLNMAKDAKKFSLVFDEIDLSTEQTFTHGTYLVENDDSTSLSFSGQIGIITEEISDTKFASIVITIAIY